MGDVYVQIRLDDRFRIHSINLGQCKIHSTNLHRKIHVHYKLGTMTGVSKPDIY